jgi:hypothetical protein
LSRARLLYDQALQGCPHCGIEHCAKCQQRLTQLARQAYRAVLSESAGAAGIMADYWEHELEIWLDRAYGWHD